MIRVQIDEWLPEEVAVDHECEPVVSTPGMPHGDPTRYMRGKLLHRRTLLLQDCEDLDVQAVIALLNGLTKLAPCRCGHEKETHVGGGCGNRSTSLGCIPGYHIVPSHICDCKEYQPVTVNDLKEARNETISATMLAGQMEAEVKHLKERREKQEGYVCRLERAVARLKKKTVKKKGSRTK